MKKVTSQDVAALAGVSQSTVSLILNNSSKIVFSSETKERVYAAAQQIGYRLPSHGGPEKVDRKRLIMVLTPTLANQYYSELIQAIEQYANECGYHVVFCDTFRKSELEQYYLDICAQMQVEGIIFTFLPSFPRMVEQMSGSIPIVLIGEKRDDLSISSVELCNMRAGSLIVDHLIELGHRRFAYLSTPMNNFTLAREQRLAGIRSRLRDYNLEENLKVVFWEASSEYDASVRPFEYDTGYSLAADLLKSNCEATAIIGANDMTALGIVAAIKELGKSIPKDFSVCGFDNIFPAILSSPSLTTVEHHLHIRGKAAVDMIISKIEADTGKNQTIASVVNKIEYEPQLVVRDSTGKPRG